MKVVIFSRVSSLQQDFQRQTTELNEYASKMGYSVVAVFEEKISGAKKNEERPALTEMMKFIKENKVNKVLTWELSRIGRDTIQVLQTIELLNKNNISLYIKNFNIETLDAEGKQNVLSSFLIQILSSVYQMERTQIRSRIASGYQNFRSAGGKVGRKTGYKKSDEKFKEENQDVFRLLKANQKGKTYSVRQIMVLTNKSSSTVQKAKGMLHGTR
jgi:DNA invertase Pin-like site-specific DNA recombinase